MSPKRYLRKIKIVVSKKRRFTCIKMLEKVGHVNIERNDVEYNENWQAINTWLCINITRETFTLSVKNIKIGFQQ